MDTEILRFVYRIDFHPQVTVWETHSLLDLLENANLKHWKYDLLLLKYRNNKIQNKIIRTKIMYTILMMI
jgi:hypothetical protein